MNIKPALQQPDARLENADVCFHAGEDERFLVQAFYRGQKREFIAAAEGQLFDRLVCRQHMLYLLNRVSDPFRILLGYYNGDMKHFGKLDQMDTVFDNRFPLLHHCRQSFLDIDNQQGGIVFIKKELFHRISFQL
jgi:hypothetical protein